MKTNYSQTVGYSPLDCVDHEKLLHVIRICKNIIAEYLKFSENSKILVAGAGSGVEAVLISQEFNQKTFGVDLNIDLNNQFSKGTDLLLQVQDLSSLAFSENTFELAYSYHVLEHVPNPSAVLIEITRVLKPGGVLYIGFPNKNRLFSYLGTSQKASVLDKIRWNFNDYQFRLQGKFKNESGAHAGFTEKEFIDHAAEVFAEICPVRNKYMLLKYPKLRWILRFFIQTRLEEYLFPSNYFLCKKG